jgi:hypothetical protein
MKKTPKNAEPYPLSEEQIKMLRMSDDDIKNGRLISHEQVDKEDRWLFKFSKAQRKELDRRCDDYQNVAGKTYTWEEAVAITDKTLEKRKV